HQPLCLLLIGLVLLLTDVMVSQRRTHPLKNAFLQLLAAQEPSSPHDLPFPWLILAPSFLHRVGEAMPPSSVITLTSHFPQQPIDAQPGRPRSRPLQVLWITAPAIFLERFVGLEKFGPYRIQMHVVADGPQITVPATLHDQGLVTAAEQVTKE